MAVIGPLLAPRIAENLHITRIGWDSGDGELVRRRKYDLIEALTGGCNFELRIANVLGVLGMIEITDLNHVALQVSNVAKSIEFYEQVVCLKQKDRPDFDFDGAWFALGDTRELHLLEGLDTPVHEHPRGSHFAMEVRDFESCQKHLEDCGANIININIRPDGAKQVFIEDPDQHVVEFCYLGVE